MSGSQEARRAVALAGLGLASVAIVAGGIVGGRIGDGLFLFAGLLFPFLLLVCAARSRRHPVLLRFVVLMLGGVLLLVGCAVRLFSGGGPVLHGLPLATWLMAVGLGWVPLVLVGLGYAATFDESDPGERP